LAGWSEIEVKTIHKYPVFILDEFRLPLPIDAQILTVQMQHGDPYIWAKVDPDAAKEMRNFRLYGTGHPMDQDGQYVGTFQAKDGQLVFHLFEV
jgi:hypothetical protein